MFLRNRHRTTQLTGVAATLLAGALVLSACGEQPDGTGLQRPVTGPAEAPSDGTDEPDPDTTDGRDRDKAGPDGNDGGEGADGTDGTSGDDREDRDGHGHEAASMRFAECDADHYSVGHPRDWNTNADDGLLGPCEIFHPGEIEVPERPRDGDLHYAVWMYIDDVDYDDRLTADNPNEVVDQRETMIDGRRALAVEYRSTGEALIPEGEYAYTWTVDLDGRILVATTSTIGSTPYDRDKQVLDRMVTEELDLHDDTSPVAGPATTDPSSQEADGGPLTTTDVRIGSHDGFDRLVFEIAGDGDAGWQVEYDDEPRAQGSGKPVEIVGEAALRVRLRGMAYEEDAPEEPYDGPQRVEPSGTNAIVEVVQGTLHEGDRDFFVGLDRARPYRLERLRDPQRLVIDLETR